jgi:uncharacterized membrane protein YhaH (DUF805 family)
VSEGPATALQPLRHYARFRGRSTRFEMVLFAILIAILFIATGYAEPLIGAEALLWTQRGLLLLLACPILALIVRRLHDSGRSGWWALVGLPLLGFELWEAYVHHRDPLAPSPIDSLPLGARVALALTGVALFILLVWDDEQADNRHGPNPRRGAAPRASPGTA